jgi:hypothetical protein
MAKLWFCRQGDHPTTSAPAVVRPFSECKPLLQLAGHLYLGTEARNVRFGMPGHPLASTAGSEHVIIALEAKEAKAAGWKPGYYYSPLSPQEAFELLGLWV